jgi:hypothetical protein
MAYAKILDDMNIMKILKIFSSVCKVNMSPYPTVIIVVTLKYNADMYYSNLSKFSF